jgi:alpha-N-acetylglucosaminidase
MKLFLRYLILLLAINSQALAQVDIKATDAFIKRIVKSNATNFIVEEIKKENNKDVFELESKAGKIILRGNNGLSIASALNYYLKNYCHVLYSWNEFEITLPAELPKVTNKVRRITPYQYRYYLNYCTFNYSMSWWKWDRWQQEIDWMCLNGINMPLAITGEEAIWRKLYLTMGFSDAELNNFFTGPAYFSWFWMGNIDGWGGPLPLTWMNNQEALQKKILLAERSMGMTPILPAFTGHIPPTFKDHFVNAKVKKTNWGAGFKDVYILDANDPMFDTIGQKFISLQTKEYGTDHFYSADTFNENLPPSNDSIYLNDISKKVFESMSHSDPKAVWVMQGWMFHYQAEFWKTPQIKALLNAIPNDKMILLDLYSESHPLWANTDAYYGKPWIWNMLQNFGGNVSMWGRMPSVANDPSQALGDKNSGKMLGIGLTPEGIEQNPALFHLMLENVWQDKPIDLKKWLKDYAYQRYGVINTTINEAWKILAATVYNGGLGEGGPESIIAARPTINVYNARIRTKLDYQPKDLAKALALFNKAIPALAKSEGFKYDLVDLTRQQLANYATPLHQKIVLAYLQHDLVMYDLYTKEFIELMSDMDLLLNTRSEFLLGKWINEARACGTNENEKNLYELNARNLITLWGDKESELSEYSNRQWAGLVKDYYKPRWVAYFSYIRNKITYGARMETDDFEKNIKNWEWNWVNSNDQKYSDKPIGDPIKISNQLFKKYQSKF